MCASVALPRVSEVLHKSLQVPHKGSTDYQWSGNMAEEESRTITLTQKGKEYQMELASKDFKRVRSKLTNHLALFETLLRGKDKDLIRTEIEKLNEIAEELKGSVGKYSGLLDGKGEEEKIKAEVLQIFAAEMESISRVKEEVTEWLQENLDPNGKEKPGNKLNPTEDEVEDIDKEMQAVTEMLQEILKPSISENKPKKEDSPDKKAEDDKKDDDEEKTNLQMTIEVMRVQTKLENQVKPV